MELKMILFQHCDDVIWFVFYVVAGLISANGCRDLLLGCHRSYPLKVEEKKIIGFIQNFINWPQMFSSTVIWR
jgi:hypothetical protein